MAKNNFVKRKKCGEFNVFHYKTIDSTQKEIWRRVKNGTIENKTMIIADIQTSGIGTHGRVWHTDEENNIAFSVYFDLSQMACKVDRLEGLTVRIAENIVDVFYELYGINLMIKFPNDIYCNGKKLGGILTETKVQEGLVRCIVIGIGINTNQIEFADEIKCIATSVRREFGIEVDNEKVIFLIGTVSFSIWTVSFCEISHWGRFLSRKEPSPIRNASKRTGPNGTFQREKGRNFKMKIGFLFPGQGSQFVGMGKEIYESDEDAKKIYDKVKEITKIDIAKISFEGPEEILNQTKYTQLAILTNSLAHLEILKKQGIEADISAGLSLGEYTALIYSKVLSFEEGVRLVQKRGEFMQELAPKGNWKMAAILGVSDEEVEQLCNQVKEGFAVPVNYNCPGQVVVTGDEAGIANLQDVAKESGVRKVRILKTSGPFHTEKLRKSSDALRNELERVEIHKFERKVVKNINGELYTDEDDVRDILAKHIISPVRFSKCLMTMKNMGVDDFIEVGPGKTLSGFVKRM